MPATKLAGNTKTAKQCTKGWSCGFTCITKGKDCKSQLPGQAKTYAHWLSNQLKTGGKLSPAHEADAKDLGLATKPKVEMKVEPKGSEDKSTKEKLPQTVNIGTLDERVADMKEWGKKTFGEKFDPIDDHDADHVVLHRMGYTSERLQKITGTKHLGAEETLVTGLAMTIEKHGYRELSKDEFMKGMKIWQGALLSSFPEIPRDEKERISSLLPGIHEDLYRTYKKHYREINTAIKENHSLVS